MALPTLNVTPGSGATINTLPNAPAPTANSVSVALATDQAAIQVTAAALPLPNGAATSAKQPAPGIAGTPSPDVITIQGSPSATPIASTLADPATGNKANIFQFHNADNVALGGAAFGVNTGGVAQLLNAFGNLDRQREAGVDGVAAQGIAAGATSLAMQFKTASASAIASGSQTVTPAAMSGTVGGVPWSIQTGSVLAVDTGANRETVVVTATAANTFTAVFGRPHATSPVQIIGFVFNQGRDAAGENDGASGSGTAIAAEYEFNGGDPSGGNFDRARNLNGKGLTTQTISAGGGAGSKSLAVASATGLQPGVKVLLYQSSSFPAAGSFESVNVDLSYIPGATTVPLASAIIGSVGYDTVAYDSFLALGPQLNGFLPFGVGLGEEAIFDPVSGKYFIQRSATSDGAAPQNVGLQSPALWNGTGFDRATGATGRGLDVNLKNASIAVTGAFWQALQPVNPVAAIPISNRSGYINGAATSASVTTLSTAGGFTIGDTLTMPSAPYVTAPAVLTISNIQAVALTPTIANSGTGGGTGAVTLTGTDGTGTKFVFAGTMTAGVLTISGGPTTAGNYTVAPANANNSTGPGCAVSVTGAGAGTATGVQLYVKFTPVIGALAVTTPGVYAPGSAANIASLQAATAPASTSGAGSLAGLTCTLNTFSALSTTVAASNASRQYLAVENSSTSQNIGISLNGAATLGSPGTKTLLPNFNMFEWAGNRIPSNALTAIGAAPFQPFTVWEG